MSKKDFNVQCSAQVDCTRTKKEDLSSEESSFKISIMFGLSITRPNVIEKTIKVFTLIIKYIIAHLHYMVK